MKTDDIINDITEKVGSKFRCFGGGNTSSWNPITAALKGKELQFAAGVSVEKVVEFIIAEFLEHWRD